MGEMFDVPFISLWSRLSGDGQRSLSLFFGQALAGMQDDELSPAQAPARSSNGSMVRSKGFLGARAHSLS
jgi:hypothetical protein